MEDDSVEPISSKSEVKPSLKSASEPKASEPKSDSKITTSKSSDVPKPVNSARSPGAAATAQRAARADFFTSPPEPLRLDPFKMFGMARKNPLPAEEQKSESITNDKVVSPASGAGEVESDEATENQVKFIFKITVW